jgi:tetratricopeptide (TPR) repeat protein
MGLFSFLKKFWSILFLTAFWSCQVRVSIKKPFGEYFDDSTFQVFKNGMDACSKAKYVLADSLLTIVISRSKNKLPITMPREANPYYYRGNNDIQIGKYEQALSDMDHVATDTTTQVEVILVRCEALKELKKYDACIALCNKLILLKYDSVASLSERGVCYYYKGELDKACGDLNYCKRNSNSNPEFIAYLNQFLKNCK